MDTKRQSSDAGGFRANGLQSSTPRRTPRRRPSLRRKKTFPLYMYFYITLQCIGYSPSIPLSRHDSLPAQRTRRPPSDMPPGTVHPGGGLKHWDVSLLRSMQKLAKPGRVISSSIVLLTTAFAPSVWFNREIMSNIRNVDHQLSALAVIWTIKTSILRGG